jgi:hypothetical protein
MKKVILTLIGSVVITVTVFTQSAGDYRSVANGNWNDVTKWETYNGSSWVSANTYPGQTPGTGTVTIIVETTMLITANVPYPITNLLVDNYQYFDDYLNEYYVYGYVTFSAESTVSLTVSGNVVINGKLSVANQIGAKSHSLFIGRSLEVYYGDISTINEDDKLIFIFNTTDSNSGIKSYSGIYFQDITFNGTGITVSGPIYIMGTATFIRGVVVLITNIWYPGSIFFDDGASVTGASNTSFVDGIVYKKGDDAFTFPIGDEGVYSPLAMSAPNEQEEIFVASYVHSYVLAWAAISDPGLYSVSDCGYWGWGNANSNIPSDPLDVTVGWTASSGCGPSSNISNVSEVTLAHITGNIWDSHGGIGTGTATNGSVTWSGLTNFGTFTLGNVNASCAAPSGLNATNIGSNSATVSWSDVPGSVSYDVDYKATSSYYWTHVETGITPSANLSALSPSTIYDWKVRANCSSGPSSYRYRQTQFTTLPCGTPTGLSTTNISAGSATLNWIALPYATSYRVQYKQSTSSIWLSAAFETNSPSYNLSGLSGATGYDWRVQAVCGGPPAGDYAQTSFITLTCDNAYEPNNTSNDAKTIALGTTAYAGITSTTDVDWFKVTTLNNSNTILWVELGNIPAGSDYDLYVYNKNFVLVGSSTNSGSSMDMVSYDSHGRNATYYIKIVGKNGAYNISQCYNLWAQVSSSAHPPTNVSNPVDEITEESTKEILYPNPASDFAYLRFNSVIDGMFDVQILNAVGQLVKQYPINVAKGYNQVKIRVNDIRAGMYLLKINKGDLSITKKFVIAR